MTNHIALKRWIEECAELRQPDDIVRRYSCQHR